MKWIRTDEELPKFNVKVLGWEECEYCKKGKEHAVAAVKKSYPHHGAYMTEYYPPDPAAANYLMKEGREIEAEKYKHPHWNPHPPSYWTYIDSPYEEGK